MFFMIRLSCENGEQGVGHNKIKESNEWFKRMYRFKPIRMKRIFLVIMDERHLAQGTAIQYRVWRII